MVKVKKSVGSADVPHMDILAARLKVVEAKLELEAKEVNLDDGRSFVADPSLSLKFVVEANLVDPGIHEGASFYDRFKLKQNEDGDWVIAKFSKLGNLVGLRYGESWFEDENAGIDEDDFVDWQLIAHVKGKTDSRGKALPGSTIDWQSMRKVSDAAEEQMVLDVSSDEDFDNVPF